MIDFLELDDDLIKVAARNSRLVPAARPADYEALLGQLPEPERQEFLQRLLRAEPSLTQQLQRRLLEFRPTSPGDEQSAALPRRTLGALLEEVEGPNEAGEQFI